MFVTNWISTTKIQKISEITNFFRHYFLSRTEVSLALLERARAWEWVKDPPAGEGQVGQKHLFGKGGTGRIEKRGYILSSLTFLPTGAEVFFTSFFS